MDIFKIARKRKTIYHSKSSFFQIIRPLSRFYYLNACGKYDITALILINRVVVEVNERRSRGSRGERVSSGDFHAHALWIAVRVPHSPPVDRARTCVRLRDSPGYPLVPPTSLLALRPATRITRSRDLMQAFTIVTAPISSRSLIVTRTLHAFMHKRCIYRW